MIPNVEYYDDYDEYYQYDNNEYVNNNDVSEKNPISNKKLTNKSKNTTYSDILSNLNIIVIDGKLKLIKKNTNTINSYFTNQNNIDNNIDNYNNNQEIPNQNVFINKNMSPQDIKKLNTIRYINWLKEKQRIASIKPRNMFFNNGNNFINQTPNNPVFFKQSTNNTNLPQKNQSINFKSFVFKK